MKKIYIQPVAEMLETMTVDCVLVKGSDEVKSYDIGNDINIGDEDEDEEANSFGKSLWE